MKMKRFISAVAALAMSVSCFAGLTITGHAETTEEVFSPVADTYVDSGAEDTVVHGEEATLITGYNNINSSTGAIGFANSGWGVNHIGYMKYNVSNPTKGAYTGIARATLTFKADGSGRAHNYGIGYTAYEAWDENLTWNIASTYAMSTITMIGGTQSIAKNATGTLSYDVTDYVKADADGVLSFAIYDTAAGGGNIQSKEATTEADRPTLTLQWASVADYTVNYKIDGAGDPVKTITVEDAIVGETPTVSMDYFEVTTGEGDEAVTTRYICDSNDLGDQKVAEGLVITVNVHVAKTTNVTVNQIVKNAASDETPISTTVLSAASGTMTEGTDYVFGYPRYVYDETNHIIYEAAKNQITNNSYFRGVIAAADFTEDAIVKNVTYTKSKENVVFFVDLDGTDGQNAAIRASNGRAYDNQGYTSTEDIPVGIYTVYATVQSQTRGSSVKVGDKTIFDLSDLGKGSWNDKTVENVEIDTPGKLSLVKGSNNSLDDYDTFIFVKTADIAPTAEVKDGALFQPVNPANGEHETVSFDALIGSDTLTTKTIEVKINNTDATLPKMSINGGEEFTPAWTAKTDATAGTRTFYAQFMAAEDDLDEFGTIVVKYGEQTVLSTTLVTNSDPTP